MAASLALPLALFVFASTVSWVSVNETADREIELLRNLDRSARKHRVAFLVQHAEGAAAAFGVLLYRLDPNSLKRPALDILLVTGASIGLLALGAGLTLRAGVPNLALDQCQMTEKSSERVW